MKSASSAERCAKHEHVPIALHVVVNAFTAWCKYLVERDEEIDRTEFARLRGWASLIIAAVLGLIYLGFTIFGKG